MAGVLSSDGSIAMKWQSTAFSVESGQFDRSNSLIFISSNEYGKIVSWLHDTLNTCKRFSRRILCGMYAI